jgi:GNAT superfamily N-acetyltransferase
MNMLPAANPAEWRIEYSFEEMAPHHAVHGRPGLGQERLTWWVWVIDCLLYRDDKGALVGILYHYVKPEAPDEREWAPYPGCVDVWVKPNCQRRGIGAKLLLEAVLRFGVNLSKQRYTPAGWRMAKRVDEILRRRSSSAGAAQVLEAALSVMERANCRIKRGVERFQLPQGH